MDDIGCLIKKCVSTEFAIPIQSPILALSEYSSFGLIGLVSAYTCVNSGLFLCSLVFSPDDSVVFETVNLNSGANWFTDVPDSQDGKQLPVLSMQQLEKDTIFIGVDRIPNYQFGLGGNTCKSRT